MLPLIKTQIPSPGTYIFTTAQISLTGLKMKLKGQWHDSELPNPQKLTADHINRCNQSGKSPSLTKNTAFLHSQIQLGQTQLKYQ